MPTKAYSVEDGNLSTRPIVTSRSRDYKDIDLSFKKRTSGEVFKKTDAASVKQANKNLLLTNKTEKPFNPFFGGSLNRFLFSLVCIVLNHEFFYKMSKSFFLQMKMIFESQSNFKL